MFPFVSQEYLVPNDFNKNNPDHLQSSSADHHYVDGGDKKRSSPESTKQKRFFTKELGCMMYGFGDDRNPYRETVNMLEDLVLKFICDVIIKAQIYQHRKDHHRLTIEDIMFAIGNDPKKCSRVCDLLKMNLKLKRARKAFDEVQYQVATATCAQQQLQSSEQTGENPNSNDTNSKIECLKSGSILKDRE